MSKKDQIYLLFGQEGVLLHEYLLELREKLKISDLNYNVLDGDIDLDKIQQNLETVSLFNIGKRMVVIKNFSQLSAKRETTKKDTDDKKNSAKNKKKDNDVDRLIAILNSLDEQTLVVFTFQEDTTNWRKPIKVDKRKKLYKKLQSIGTVIPFNPFSEYEREKLYSWVNQRISKYNKTITNEASHALVEIAGQSLSVLASEIYKLVTFIGDNEQITKENVLTLASESKTAAFALINNLRDRKAKDSLETFKKAIYYGENHIVLLTQIVNQFRMLLQVKYLQEQKADLKKITSVVGGHPFVIKLLSNSAKLFSFDELLAIMHLLADADFYFKTGKMEKDILLENVIVAICTGSFIKIAN